MFLFSQVASEARKNATVYVDEAKLRKASQLYTLKENDHLLKYHTACNEASYDLYKEDPSLINNKATLMRLAADKVRLTYDFKKKKSRSGQTAKKREVLTIKMREEKKDELKQDIETLQLKMKLTQQQIEKHSNQKCFAQAIEGTDRLGNLRLEWRQKRSELQMQLSKEKNAKRAAKQRKNSKTVSRKQNSGISKLCSDHGDGGNLSEDSEVFELVTVPKNVTGKAGQQGDQENGDEMDVTSGNQGDLQGNYINAMSGSWQGDRGNRDEMDVISGSQGDLQENNKNAMSGSQQGDHGNGKKVNVFSSLGDQGNRDDVDFCSESEEES